MRQWTARDFLRPRAVSSLEFESNSDLYHDAGGDLDAAVVPKFLANVTGTRFGACDPRASAFDGVSTFHVNFMFHAARTGSRSTTLISPLHRND